MAKKTDGGATAPEDMSLLRKITVRDVMGKSFMAKLAGWLDDQKSKKAWLVRIVGVSNLGTPGSTDKGNFIKFVGEFEATNLVTGEVHHSAACILPNFIAEQIYAAIQPKEGDTSRRMATFAFEIGAHFDDSAITHYVFDVKALKAPQMSGLLAELKSGLPALPAPKEKLAA